MEDKGKRILTINEVLDYCFCPLYHDIKNKNPNEINVKTLYDRAIHKVLYAYLIEYQQIQEDKSFNKSLEFLKKRWAREWIKEKKNSEIVLTASSAKRDSYENKRRKGIEAIITFDEIMSTPQCPILINYDYTIGITNSIALSGTIEYVREIVDANNTRKIQLLKFRTESNKFQVNMHMKHDLELTAASMAFKEKFNVDEFELVYVDIYKKAFIPSSRNAKDIKLLKRTVKSVDACLRAGVLCVSPDNKCFHCEYRDKCVKLFRD